MDDPTEDPASSGSRALELPFDFPRRPSRATRWESYAFEIPVPTLDYGGDLDDAIRYRAALAIAWGVALHRHSGQAFIPFAVSRLTRAGRVLSSSPICLKIEPAATFRQLLGRTMAILDRPAQVAASNAPSGSGEGETAQASASGSAAITWLEARASEDEDTDENRDADENADEAGVFRALRSSTRASREADLHLVVAAGGRRRAVLVYDASLFRQATIARFADHFCVLLEDLAAHPDKPVAQLAILTNSERAWIEKTMQGRSSSAPLELIHEQVERHAASTPDAVALRFRDQSLTYRELNRRAHQLAHHLIALRIGAGSRVAVCVEPSFDIIVALLAILEAGAVYVPIDPTYPPARIRTLLDDTQPKLVIAQTRGIERLSAYGFAALALDGDELRLAELPDARPEVAIRADDPASIYYTSGTTGQPKGVVATHDNLRHYLYVARERYGFGSRDIMPAIARFGFSISMFELMLPLVSGGTLVLLDREHVLDPARMARTLAEVTFFHAGPSLLRTLIAYIKGRYASFEPFSRVRHASSGGDMVAPEILESLKEIFSNAEVFVIYGCSEISCMGCTYPVPRDEVVEKTYVGRPFDNTTVRVLDAAQNQVPIGVVGEIYFAGNGVVSSYWKQPDLTSERFIEIDQRRFYRTGDMGRLSERGWLEVLGRSDFQIKLRGMRIELGEIEYHLRRAPGVRDGVVAARDGADGEKLLVAYVALERDDGQRGEEHERRARLSAIRRYMAEQLPDYMVPALYVEMGSMPLNHNMKIDRRALPEPTRVGERAAAGSYLREPETSTERRLASLWRKHLRVEHVELDDNFFELGGDSMLAMAFVLDVERETGIRLEGMEVLREPLDVLASICDRRGGKTTTKIAQPAAAPHTRIEIFHFGPGASLYGAIHRAPEGSVEASSPEKNRIGDAALICGPVGQERVRAHFVLNGLARQLAAQGMPVLSFDYYALGDSLGESIDATCGRWRRDIVDARRELERRTGRSRVVAIGVRFGATLLCNALEGLEISRLVLWDPVCRGAEYYAELSQIHRKCVRGMLPRPWRKRRARREGEELLGVTYSKAALVEMQDLAIVPTAPGMHVAIQWLATSQAIHQKVLFDAIVGKREACRVEIVEGDCGWREAARIEEILPDTGISRRLAAMVLEQAPSYDEKGATARERISAVVQKG